VANRHDQVLKNISWNSGSPTDGINNLLGSNGQEVAKASVDLWALRESWALEIHRNHQHFPQRNVSRIPNKRHLKAKELGWLFLKAKKKQLLFLKAKKKKYLKNQLVIFYKVSHKIMC
jgi:hypothetical protein